MPNVDYGNGLIVHFSDAEYKRLEEIRKNMDPARPKQKMKPLSEKHFKVYVSLPVWLHDMMDKDSTERGEGVNEYIQDAILRKATKVEGVEDA